MCNLDTFPKALEFWGCTFSFGRTAIEIVSVDVDTVDLVPSFSRESLNSYSPPVFVVVVDQRVVPLLSLKWPLDVPINVHTTRQQVSTTVRHLKISHTMRHAPVTNATKRTHSLTSGWKIPDTTTVHWSHLAKSSRESQNLLFSRGISQQTNKQQQQYSSLSVQSSPPSADLQSVTHTNKHTHTKRYIMTQ